LQNKDHLIPNYNSVACFTEVYQMTISSWQVLVTVFTTVNPELIHPEYGGDQNWQQPINKLELTIKIQSEHNILAGTN
jgi:hypothetical protein